MRAAGKCQSVCIRPARRVSREPLSPQRIIASDEMAERHSMPSLTNSNVYVVTIRRSERNEPEAYYMPAPNPEVAETRVRRIAKAAEATIISVQTENRLVL